MTDKKYYAEHAEEERARARDRYWRNAETRREYGRRYYAENKDEVRARRKLRAEQEWAGNLKRRYGITEEQYMDLLDAQDCACAICGLVSEDKKLVVDHDHATGRVRSLLCSNCNTALGLFRDDPNLLVNAAMYLVVG